MLAGGTPSSAIPIRGTRHPKAQKASRQEQQQEEEGKRDTGMVMGASISPPKLSPTILRGGLISPGSSADIPSRCRPIYPNIPPC